MDGNQALMQHYSFHSLHIYLLHIMYLYFRLYCYWKSANRVVRLVLDQFLSPVACLVSPISAIGPLLDGRPHKTPRTTVTTGDMLKLARWLWQCMREKNLQSLPSSNFQFFQGNNYSLASLICEGCIPWLANDWKAETSARWNSVV